MATNIQTFQLKKVEPKYPSPLWSYSNLKSGLNFIPKVTLQKEMLRPLTCTMFMDAAPALPTLHVTGLTRADLAKFWIFFGMVAEKSSV